MKKRLCSLLLALAMVVTYMPAMAFAETEKTTAQESNIIEEQQEMQSDEDNLKQSGEKTEQNKEETPSQDGESSGGDKTVSDTPSKEEPESDEEEVNIKSEDVSVATDQSGYFDNEDSIASITYVPNGTKYIYSDSGQTIDGKTYYSALSCIVYGDTVRVTYQDGSSKDYNYDYNSGPTFKLPENYEFVFPEDTAFEGTGRFSFKAYLNRKDGDGNWSRMTINGDVVEIDIPVTIKERPQTTVASISFNPANTNAEGEVEFNEYTGGYYSGDNYYYNYRFQNGDALTMTYNDGSTETFVYSIGWGFDSSHYSLSVGSSLYSENTDNNIILYFSEYDPETHMFLKQTECYVPFTVIEGREIEWIDYTPIVADMPQYTNGVWNKYYIGGEQVSYYQYNTYRTGDILSVKYKDADEPESYTYNGWSFVCKSDASKYLSPGSEIDFSSDQGYQYSDDQSYFNEWGIGIHEVSVGFNGESTSFELEVYENTKILESFRYDPGSRTIDEYTGGFYSGDNYYYNTSNFAHNGDKVIVKYRNGNSDTYEYSDGKFYNKDGDTVDVSFVDDQNTNPWTAGEHEVTVRCGNLTSTLSVIVKESQLASFEIENDTTPWAVETNFPSTSASSIKYSYLKNSKLKMTYTNGKTVMYTLDNDGYEFITDEPGYEAIALYGYDINVSPVENKWSLGETGHIKFTYLGKSCTKEVNIVSSVVSAVYTPKNKFYYYEGFDEVFPQHEQVGDTLKLTDGSDNVSEYSYTDNGWELTSGEIDRNPYVLLRSDPDDSDKKVMAFVSFLYNSVSLLDAGTFTPEGRTTDSLNISRIEYIQKDGVPNLYRGIDSRIRSDYDDDGNVLGTYEIFPYYEAMKEGDQLKIYYSDGRSTESYTLLYDDDDDYYFYDEVNKKSISFYGLLDVTSDQAYDNEWRAGNHSFTLSYLGIKTNINVVIKDNPVQSIKYSVDTVRYDAASVGRKQTATNGKRFTYYDLDRRTVYTDEDGDENNTFFVDGEKLTVNKTDGSSVVYTYNSNKDGFFDASGNETPYNVYYEESDDYDQYLTPLKTGREYKDYIIISYAGKEYKIGIYLEGEHEHDLTLVKAVPASCGEDGNIKYYTCDGCDKLFAYADASKELSRDEIVVKASSEHAWGEGRVKKEASCGEEGLVEFTCSNCGKTKEETTPKLPHAWGTPEYSWATDNSTATATHTCNNDANHVETETVTVRTVSTSADCFTPGHITYYADFTKAGFETQSKDGGESAAGHVWGEVKYTWSDDYSKCTAKRVCTRDASHSEEETVDSTRTDYSAATCKAKGSASYKATFINAAFLEQTKTVELPIDEKAHNLKHYNGEAATCTAGGRREYWQCELCDKMFADAEGKTEISESDLPVEALGHNLIKQDREEPGYDTVGHEEHYKCTRCNKLFSDAEGKKTITQPVEIESLKSTAEAAASEAENKATDAVSAARTAAESLRKASEAARNPGNAAIAAANKAKADADAAKAAADRAKTAAENAKSAAEVAEAKAPEDKRSEAASIVNHANTLVSDAVTSVTTATEAVSDARQAVNKAVSDKNAADERARQAAAAAAAAAATAAANNGIVDLPVVKISKPKAAKKAATVKWKKVSKKNQKRIQGIEIQIAADPGFTQIVKSATAGKKKSSKKIKGLQSKTIYYVRVRAYRNAADGKHVSEWRTKTVKAK